MKNMAALKGDLINGTGTSNSHKVLIIQQYFSFNSGRLDDTDAVGSFYHFKKPGKSICFTFGL